MIPAHEARKTTNHVRGVIEVKEAKRQLLALEMAIRKASKAGDAYVLIADMYGDNQGLLEDYGYTVEWDDEEGYFMVKW